MCQDVIVIVDENEDIKCKAEPHPDKIEPRSCCNKANTLRNWMTRSSHDDMFKCTLIVHLTAQIQIMETRVANFF